MLSYFGLGRLEDPEFTIRSAQIVTEYPGATAMEVADRVTDKIETAVQRLGRVKHVTSTSYPGRSIVMVELVDETTKDELPQIWDELRRKIGDAAREMPNGASQPVVNDDYGDVYGMFYAISGDGYGYAEIKEQAKMLRKELLLCKDVAKIDLLGERDQIISLQIPRVKIADLGITPEMIASALQGHTDPSDAGHFLSGDKYIRFNLTPTLTSMKSFHDILIKPNVRLGDICEYTLDYVDPPSVIVKRNGKPCIALGISTAKGGNVVTMGNAVEQRMKELIPIIPVGFEIDVISHQASSVTTAVNGFVENLIESVILVVAVLLFTMGMKSGLIIGGILILTVLATVFVMDLMGLMFERISLGAFIIALGMLVDNAIVITEAVLVAEQQGKSRMQAAIDIVKQTQWALLGGTSIAILSFAPIGASQNSTGEYCRSLFLVIAISLLISWVTAITVTPLVAEWGLKTRGKKADSKDDKKDVDPYGSPLYRAYRWFLEACINYRWATMVALIAMLVASVWGFGLIKQNFFPDSTRPQFMVHVWMPEGTHIEKTSEQVDNLCDYITKLDNVTGVSSFVGTGALRFLLTYSPEEPNAAYGLIMVDVPNDHVIGELMEKIENEAASVSPDAMVGCQRFVLGPGAAQKIQVRILGKDPGTLREIGDKALQIMRDAGGLKEIQSDWRNRAELMEPVVSVDRAAKLGVSRSDVAQAYRLATAGLTVGSCYIADEKLALVLRAPKNERDNISGVRSGWAWSPSQGTTVPILQLIDGMRLTSEDTLLKRRDRTLCLTVKCNPKGDEETASAAFDRILPKLEELGKTLPAGYYMQWGGEYEDSNEAQSTLAPTFAPILATMVLVVLMLFNSVKKTLVIFLTLPLIIIGVVAGLLGFDQPFGFMALLGLLSLVGMQVKNAIVLMDEIQANQDRGLTDYQSIVDAGVSRLRPVANASLTTVLGMIPLLTDAFYVAMAVTIMIGLSFATVLTMVVIPVNYAIIFNIRRDKPAS